jgi:hypothetical protein
MDPSKFQSEEDWISKVDAKIAKIMRNGWVVTNMVTYGVAIPVRGFAGTTSSGPSKSDWSADRDHHGAREKKEYENGNRIYEDRHNMEELMVTLSELQKMPSQRREKLAEQGGLNSTENRKKYDEDQLEMKKVRLANERTAAAEKLARDNAERKRVEYLKQLEWETTHDSAYGRQGDLGIRMDQLHRLSVNARLL